MNARAARAVVLLTLLALTLNAAAVYGQANDRDDDGLRDRVEERWGLTSPDDADSDGDGVLDPAEDHDGDRLSALGEQRFGTDATNPDSDGDGVLDGDEDSDGDGTNDAQEQDKRRAPAKLRPEPEVAFWDRPDSYDDGCHSENEDPKLRTCEFGDTESESLIVLFGDSHALQWLPSIVAPAVDNGWRVVTLTKAACPPPHITTTRSPDRPQAQPSCDRWRAKAMDWIEENEPDIVMMAGAARKYNIIDARGEYFLGDDRTQEWLRGLSVTIEGLPQATHPMVLADTPFMRRINPVGCVRDNRRDLSKCSTIRAKAINRRFDQAERDLTESMGGTYADLNDKVCPYSPCPAVIGDILLYRNADHITATYAEQIAPSMGAVLSDALATLAAGEGTDTDVAVSAAPAETSPGPSSEPAGDTVLAEPSAPIAAAETDA